MKIAVINQCASVGGWRYLYKLLLAMKNLEPSLQITVFKKEKDSEGDCSFETEKLLKIGIEFDFLDIKNEIKEFRKKDKFKNHFLNKMYNKIRKKIFKIQNKNNKNNNSNINRNLEDKIEDFDLVFYSWPYGVECINTKKPIFFIPHDFIYTHSFGFDGIGIYDKGMWKANLYYQEKFVNNKAIPIVSSDYIKDEFNRTFPNAKNKPNVVYLSTLSDYVKKEQREIDKFLKAKKINDNYVLFASNNMPHKNLGNVIGAWYYVKQKYPNLKLIISGSGNNNILGKVNTPYYMDHTDNESDYDIKSLGLLNNEEFSMLMQGSKMVINASLCEAGNGSGVDAWALGVPVTMSEIEPFRNQIDCLGVKAELFDPRNSKDIARAVIELLDNPIKAKENAEISKKALEKYTWNDIAEKYLEIFRNGVGK